MAETAAMTAEMMVAHLHSENDAVEAQITEANTINNDAPLLNLRFLSLYNSICKR